MIRVKGSPPDSSVLTTRGATERSHWIITAYVLSRFQSLRCGGLYHCTGGPYRHTAPHYQRFNLLSYLSFSLCFGEVSLFHR